jgi:hypothetical protein
MYAGPRGAQLRPLPLGIPLGYPRHSRIRGRHGSKLGVQGLLGAATPRPQGAPPTPQS